MEPGAGFGGGDTPIYEHPWGDAGGQGGGW